MFTKLKANDSFLAARVVRDIFNGPAQRRHKVPEAHLGDARTLMIGGACAGPIKGGRAVSLTADAALLRSSALNC